MQFLFLDSSANTKYSEEIQHLGFFYCFLLDLTSSSTHHSSYLWMALVGTELEVTDTRPIQFCLQQELQWQDKEKWLHMKIEQV